MRAVPCCAPAKHVAPTPSPRPRTTNTQKTQKKAAGLVPIVEPEILIDGAHTAEQFSAASERAIGATVAQLWRRGVLLEGCLLKPQMVVQVRQY